MRAERDDDDFEVTPRARRQPERRLAYEIALGIVIGGSALSILGAIASLIIMRLMMSQVTLQIPY